MKIATTNNNNSMQTPANTVWWIAMAAGVLLLLGLTITSQNSAQQMFEWGSISLLGISTLSAALKLVWQSIDASM